MSGDLAGDVTPFPKTIQTARRTKKYRRKVASSKQWAGLIAERQGPCRLCAAPPPNDMHHLIPRDRGGGDVAENLIPLCRECHHRIEAREPGLCGALVASTWMNQPEPGPNGGAQDEYSFACEAAGDDWPERVYGIRYRRPA
jgi:hypothetical protein